MTDEVVDVEEVELLLVVVGGAVVEMLVLLVDELEELLEVEIELLEVGLGAELLEVEDAAELLLVEAADELVEALLVLTPAEELLACEESEAWLDVECAVELVDAPEFPLEADDEPAEEEVEPEWLEDPAPDDELCEMFSTSTRTLDVLEASPECEVPCDDV